MNDKSNEKLTKNAQELRKNMTKEEKHLWYDFLKYLPVTVHRQKVIGKYIVDFYCAKAKLVVEIDGSGHYTPQQNISDTNRTCELEKLGLKVIRLCNLDVDNNFYGVCEMIDLTVKNSLPQSR